MRVLRDPHSPEDKHPGTTALRTNWRSDRPCNRPQPVRFNPADWCCLLRRIIPQQKLLQFLEAFCPLGDELFIDEILGNKDMHDGVVEGDIGAGADLREVGGEVRQWMPAGIDTDQLRSIANRLLDERRRHRVIRSRVRAGHQADVGIGNVSKDVGHGTGADRFHQGRDRRRMTQPRAMVDVVRSQPGPDQFLKQVRFFVGALRRTEPGQRRLPCSVRISVIRLATRSSASSQVASRKAGSTSS